MAILHRTFCDTVHEARQVLATTNIFTYKRNAKILASLLEECQTFGNRMEAALGYQHDIEKLHRKRSDLKLEVELLKDTLGKKKDERVRSWPLEEDD